MRWTTVAVLLIGLAGCSAGDGSGLDENGRPLGETGSVPLAPTLESLQLNVFDRSCAVSGCHAGGSAPLGLRLDRGFSYASLVGRDSVERPELRRVAPGAPDDSYLIHKIEGIATVGGRMPLNQPPLSAEARAAVRAWIVAGAPPAAEATAARVSATEPAAGVLVTSLPASIVVSFNRPIDATTLNAATVLLDRAGADNGFSDGNEVPLTIAALRLEASARQQLSIALDGLPDVADVYRLRLIGTGAAPIREATGSALDGDGDGLAGGDFSLNFTVGDRFAGMQPTLASIQAALFTPVCTACHFGSSPPAGLNLEAGNSARLLIGVQRPSGPEIRVIPGNAADSFLVMKLEGRLAQPSQGARMPFGGPYLSPSAIAVIRAWIDGGAAP